MTKYFLSVVFFCSFAANLAAQTIPAPKPTPPGETDVVKISTNLVQVDVSVTDKSGRIVRDLRSDEIEIYQNGKKQDISNFTFISNVRDMSGAPNAKAQPQPGVPVPPTPVRVENVKRTIALVVDDLTL